MELRYIEEMAFKNGFNLKTIHKLIRKHKSKWNKITALSKVETSKPNKWTTLTYTGNESTRAARTIRKIDTVTKIAKKTNNKLNNIISNKVEQFNNTTGRGFINWHEPAATNFVYKEQAETLTQERFQIRRRHIQILWPYP